MSIVPKLLRWVWRQLSVRQAPNIRSITVCLARTARASISFGS